MDIRERFAYGLKSITGRRGESAPSFGEGQQDGEFFKRLQARSKRYILATRFATPRIEFFPRGQHPDEIGTFRRETIDAISSRAEGIQDCGQRAVFYRSAIVKAVEPLVNTSSHASGALQRNLSWQIGPLLRIGAYKAANIEGRLVDWEILSQKINMLCAGADNSQQSPKEILDAFVKNPPYQQQTEARL